MNKTNNKLFWENKYESPNLGWDIGYVSTPLKTYIDQLTNKELKILIPGAGNSYEAEYLWKNDFKNLTIIDIAKQPLSNFKKRVPDFPNEQLIEDDFFNHLEEYDLIIEQTFFCALDPKLRETYANKMHKSLNATGKLVGVFFDFELTQQGPPYGGSKEEYISLFNQKFNIKILERCYNSIKPRENSELFFIFEKK